MRWRARIKKRPSPIITATVIERIENTEIGRFWALFRQGGQQYNGPWFFSITAIE